MSFGVDLWNGFDIIKNEFSINYKRIKQILDMLTSYSLVLKEFCKGLDNLYKEVKEMKDSIKSNSLLDDSVILLLNSFKIECENTKVFHNNIIKNLCETKEKLEKIKIQISPYFTENIQNRESFNKILNNLVVKQETFNESFKELNNCLIEFEAQKLKERKSCIEKKNNKYLGNNLSNSLIKDIPSKLHNCILKLLVNKKEYINCITESDKYREIYNKETEELLVHLQKQFKLLIFLIQTIIQNYVKDKIECHNEILEINKNNDKINYSTINYKKETTDFIIKNATKEFPMNKLEFIPYKLNQNIISQKLSKYGEFSKKEQDLIFNQIKNYINENKFNVYENEYLRISLNNRSFTYQIKKVDNSNSIRRSGSSDILNLKKVGKGHFLKNLKSENIFRKRSELDKKKSKNSNSIKHRGTKEEISINSEIIKKQNYNFIKDFVSKLIMPQEENKNDTFCDIYSDNSSEENEKDKNDQDNKDKNDVSKESYHYNQLLFGFMDLISTTNKDNLDNLEFFIYILAYHRSKGFFVLNDNAYKMFINIFNYILVNFKTANNIIKNIILYSQTFYKIDEDNPDNRIYILNGLKNHVAFNDAETWHRAINYNLSLSMKNNNSYSLNIVNKEEYMKNLKKIILNTIISYLYDLKLSTSDKNVYEQVKNFYITIYKLDQKYIEEEINKLFEDKNEEEKEKKEEKKEKGNQKNKEEKGDKEKKEKEEKDEKGEKEDKEDKENKIEEKEKIEENEKNENKEEKEGKGNKEEELQERNKENEKKEEKEDKENKEGELREKEEIENKEEVMVEKEDKENKEDKEEEKTQKDIKEYDEKETEEEKKDKEEKQHKEEKEENNME